MRYVYHDLYDLQFESLVIEICHELLGAGVEGFASGKDGGRDARFSGTANAFPSTTAPHSGKFIVQAKHTANPSASISDSEFSGDGTSTVISKELARITALHAAGEVEHYLLFTNRRTPAIAVTKVRDRILDAVPVKTVHICGIEALERYLNAYPQAAGRADVSAFDAPLRITPDELANVILHLAANKSGFAEAVASVTKLERTTFADKNGINGLSNDYAKVILKCMKDFGGIKRFLAAPDNAHVQDAYMAAAEEFQSAVVSHRADFESFDRVLDYLFQLLLDRDSDLRANRRLTRAALYYMYWNCDLGTNADAEANEA